MRRRLLVLGLSAATALAACDKSGPAGEVDGGTGAGAGADAGAGAGASADAGGGANASADAGRRMPPRPVPTSSPTVTITMPVDVQLQAIQYMEAMQAAQPGDPVEDPAYAKTIAASLRGAGKPDIVGNGRRIDVILEKGCDATLPKQLIARSTGASLTTLFTHGVLVVRCADHALQCLQSTRDADDVLCTHK